MLDRLSKLEADSIYIIREAYRQFGNLGFLWSIGKDSTVLMWLIRKAFFGKIPFPCIHIDTSYKFPEMIQYRDEKCKEWSIKLIVAQNNEAIKNGCSKDRDGALECCTQLKTNALKKEIEKQGFDGLFLGIRSDEQGKSFFATRW
jgi:sulfate adenylyltransferase subunit 2